MTVASAPGINNLPLATRRHLCRKSVLSWAANCWPKRIRAFWHTKLIDRYLVNLFDDSNDDNYLMISQPPRTGKPVCVDELVLTEGGVRKRLGDIVVGDLVCTHLGRYRRVSEIFEQPEYLSLKITTRSGREIISGHDHPFLTPRGWVKASDLVKMDRLMVSTVENKKDSDRLDEEFILAGLMVGDGCVAANRQGSFQATFTTADGEQLEVFKSCCDKLGFTCKQVNKITWRMSKGIRPWCRDIGIAGLKSEDKKVPDFVYLGSNRQIQLFTDAYLSCDGNIGTRSSSSKERTDCRVELYSISKQLLEGVRHLLARLGVCSNLRPKKGRYKGEVHWSWRLSFGSSTDVYRYKQLASIPGKKQEKLDSVSPVPADFCETVTDEVVSVEEIGLKNCRCLTVEDDHTFTVNDIVVHNTMMSMLFGCTRYLAMNPDHHVYVVTHNQTLADKFGKQARRIFEAHAPEIFGVKLDPNNKSNSHWGVKDHEGSFNSVGWGGSITGNQVHVLVVDDLIKDAGDAMSITIRDQIWEWWDSTAYQRIENSSIVRTKVLSIQTRWHVDDLNGRLIQQEIAGGSMKWKKLMLPAVADRGDVMDENGNILMKKGEVLCPEILSHKQIENLRKTKSRYWFETTYQQRPVTQDGILWSADLFPDYLFVDEWPKRLQYLVLGVDPATGRALRDGDYSAIVAVGMDDVGQLYVEADMDKTGPLETTHRLARFVRRLPMIPDDIGIESQGFQFLISSMTEDTFDEEDVQGRISEYAIDERDVPVRKEDRIAELDPFIVNKDLKFVRGPGTMLLVNQLRNFPSKDHDDGPDALELAIWIMSSLV